MTRTKTELAAAAARGLRNMADGLLAGKRDATAGVYLDDLFGEDQKDMTVYSLAIMAFQIYQATHPPARDTVAGTQEHTADFAADLRGAADLLDEARAVVSTDVN